MDVVKLFEALNDNEQKELFKLLADKLIKKEKLNNYEYITVRKFNQRNDVSTRLKNVLAFNFGNDLIETIRLSDLSKCRNSGVGVVNEFKRLRGF